MTPGLPPSATPMSATPMSAGPMFGTPAFGMVTERALAIAVERDVLSADQVERLLAIERDLSPEPREAVDPEQLRFVSGFADIFVTIGILLFVGALAFIMDVRSGSTPMFAGMATSTWLLAEFFTGKRRMALPSIVLLVLFVGATLLLCLQIATALLPTSRTLPERFWFIPTPNAAALAVAAIITVAFAAMHYVRFRVPITIAAGAAALCLVALGIVASLDAGLSETMFNLTLLGCGLAVFALAMHFDMSDPERLTRRTDIAFWLHMLAAPLIVHPLIRGVLHGNESQLTPAAAAGVLWIFLLLGAVGVIIDRRAILVSGLVYAGIAFASLVRSFGLASENWVVPVALLALGAFILLLSAGWQPLRRAILRRLPSTIAHRLPHSALASNT